MTTTGINLAVLADTERAEYQTLLKEEQKLRLRMDQLIKNDGPQTHETIAQRMNISKSRVGQIQRFALQKIARDFPELRELIS